MTMLRVSVAQAKVRFADLLGRVAYGKQRVLITRRGRPMAVLVPPDRAGGERHLADVHGWLEERDGFFKTMASIVESRRTHRPRALSQ